MQPGVFALSGWDLIGALTLPAAAVREQLADGDTRWINRGAYDLLGSNPGALRSAAGLPRAVALYAARLADVPSVQAKGLLVLVHELPENSGLEITAINFGDRVVEEAVPIRGAAPGSKVVDVLDSQAPALAIGTDGSLRLHLKAFEGKALRIKG